MGMSGLVKARFLPRWYRDSVDPRNHGQLQKPGELRVGPGEADSGAVRGKYGFKCEVGQQAHFDELGQPQRNVALQCKRTHPEAGVLWSVGQRWRNRETRHQKPVQKFN